VNVTTPETTAPTETPEPARRACRRSHDAVREHRDRDRHAADQLGKGLSFHLSSSRSIACSLTHSCFFALGCWISSSGLRRRVPRTNENRRGPLGARRKIRVSRENQVRNTSSARSEMQRLHFDNVHATLTR